MTAMASQDHDKPELTGHEADGLVQDYIAGEISERDLQRLEEFLKSEPDAREHAAGMLVQHELLGEYYRQQASGDAEEFVRATTRGLEERVCRKTPSNFLARTMGAVRRHDRWGRRARRVGILRFAAVAAAVLAVLGVWWMGAERPVGRGAVIARVERASGSAVQILAGEKTLLRPGDEVRVGSVIDTGAGGEARLAWVDEPTRVEVDAGAELEVRSPKGAYLHGGRLTASVAEQNAGDAFAVQTPHALATVVGTRFSLLVAPGTGDGEASRSGSTLLEVSEGAVRLTRLTDGASREVAAGGSAMAGATADEVRVIASFDFEASPDPDHFDGRMVARPGGGSDGDRHCMKSAFGDRDGPVEVVSWHDWTKPLFVYAETGDMEFDYYLAAPAQWACVTIYDTDAQLAFNALFESRTAGRWLRARPRLSDFTSTGHPDGVQPPRGMAVHAVMIQYPAGEGRGLYVDNLKVRATEAPWTPPAPGADE